MSKIPVLITTDKDKRGVFFGYIDPKDIDKTDITAEEVQMCVYWDRGVCGVLGLAANGPNEKSRVSPPVPRGIIKGVTFVGECSPKAVEAWKKQPWKD